MLGYYSSKNSDLLSGNEAADPDGIPAAIVNLGSGLIQRHLYELRSSPFTKYQTRVGRSEFGNHLGISLLASAGKI